MTDNEKKQRTTYVLAGDVHAALHAQAALEGRTASDILEELAREYLAPTGLLERVGPKPAG